MQSICIVEGDQDSSSLEWIQTDKSSSGPDWLSLERFRCGGVFDHCHLKFDGHEIDHSSAESPCSFEVSD